MEASSFVEQVEEMTDLELAVLLSLIAQHHCMIQVDDDLVDDLASELALIVRDVFNLSYIILERADVQDVDHFGEAILADDDGSGDLMDDMEDDGTGSQARRHAPFPNRRRKSQFDSRKVVNVIIAKHFNFAHEDVQIQTLELIRKRRIYSRTTVHLAPKLFLVLPIISTSSKGIRLNKHLNDRIFMSHFHEAEDGFPNLEEMEATTTTTTRPSQDNDNNSETSASVSQSPSVQVVSNPRRIGAELIEQLRAQGKAATVTPEIRRYLQDIVVFLRMARGVDGGVTPYATTLFLALAKYLAPFHGIDYVTPALVALAAKKIYPHRIVIASPSRERSTLYGTDVATAGDLLRDLDPHKVIQEVLDTVDCPA
ncbi:hypothetical protein HRR81_003267 [Exophiala dermatitidis]|nr:hypothetical protein HRR81_003267 [Exophiala dermatitidis]KAJ4665234.1 hypothetical protein HRR95_008796 [Exophiala dermatitidis]